MGFARRSPLNGNPHWLSAQSLAGIATGREGKAPSQRRDDGALPCDGAFVLGKTELKSRFLSTLRVCERRRVLGL